MDGEDYYSSLARRVYFIAEVEAWPYAKTVKMLNDKEGFERYYEQVSISILSFSGLCRSPIITSG